ncbi:hypothetical protein ACHAWU_004549 [Discostella pseudostelligera]|uniref:FAD-binding domain-containing protein n=1 Tax=Discostella pseudostelligera TaxID=259834 RepID=A0ABD3MW48_9STRA
MPIRGGSLLRRRWNSLSLSSQPHRNRRAVVSIASQEHDKKGGADAGNNSIIHDAIIIGGGPTGLLLSNLLSNYNIHSHLLFDKRPVEELVKHPQAHFINVRSMEILKSEMPHVYDGILSDMPNVREWECFNFGGCVDMNMSTGGGKRLARVIHPVRHLLRVGQRGDAILVPDESDGNNNWEAEDVDASNQHTPYVSECRPAHLAQNKFVSLLLQEARRHDEMAMHDLDSGRKSRLRYGEEIIGISDHTSVSSQLSSSSSLQDFNSKHIQPSIITIHTSQGQTYHTRYLLAADGVHSSTRKHYGISMMGDHSIQNLINVHFRTNTSLSKYLMRRQNNQAMLHFVYNSQLVGVFVCHDGYKGEWVLQIPFFPPYQTMADFDANYVRELIWAGLGVHPQHGRNGTGQTRHPDDTFNVDILSIRPWTMTSLVASQYLNDSKNMVLVGDAAHAFPPAGGFGMNTGLQDAHNIAWRLAVMLHRDKLARKISTEEDDDNVSIINEIRDPSTFMSSSSSPSFDQTILSKYDEERKTVATQNAALSVRNYQRTLSLANACYLNAQHPHLLISILDSPPMNLLPLEVRQGMFKRLVRVAMLSLKSLTSVESSGALSIHANQIEHNVNAILENKGSLPLVFPRYELGFSYSSRDKYDVVGDKEELTDTAGYFPRLKAGHRMPHVLVDVMTSQSSDGDVQVSLTTISSYLRRVFRSPSPIFTLLVFGPRRTNTIILNKAVARVMQLWNVPIISIDVYPSKPIPHDENSIQITGTASKLNDLLSVVDANSALSRLLHAEFAAFVKAEESTNKMTDSMEGAHYVLMMIRPDGHIANVAYLRETYNSDIMLDQIQQALDHGLHNALGIKV